MNQLKALRYASLPIVAGLGVALIMACTNDLTTAPERLEPVAARFAFIDNGGGTCPGAYTAVDVKPGTRGDDNEDGVVCKSPSGGGGKKKPPKKKK